MLQDKIELTDFLVEFVLEKVKGIAHGIHGKRAEKGQKVKGKKT